MMTKETAAVTDLTDPDDEIRETAAWLRGIADYLERYPRPAEVRRYIDEMRRQCDHLAILAKQHA